VRLPVVILNSLRDFIEVPLLGSDIVSPSLEPDIVSSVAFSNSLHWESGSNVEWSIDVESKFFIQSLGLSLGCFVKIKDSPFLVVFTSVVSNTNSLSFFIL